MKPSNIFRRRFLRISGGGIVTAAIATSTSGCAQNPFTMPASAIAAWAGPNDALPIREWVLSHALLAPNPHNRQPWFVSLRGDDSIELRIDKDRLLPHTDPFGRQILIGTGAFLGLLEMAAAERGYRTNMTLFPAGFKDDSLTSFGDQPVALIRLQKDAAIAPDPLFAQVFKRRTERGAYDLQRSLPDELLAQLRSVTDTYGVTVSLATRSRPIARQLADVAKQAWAIELKTPHTFRESIELLRIGAGEIASHRDGISITDPMLVMIDKLGLIDRENAPAPDSSITQNQIEDFNGKIDSTPGFFTLVSRDNQRVTQLQAGMAYVRAQLATTSQGLAMQPISQALQEYPEMADRYQQIHQAMAAKVESGQTVQMFCRIGYLAADGESNGPSPRRGLQAHLT
ncbi:MAG: Acg family FMN-binding oxidoreductase [Burkholderiaceae bacterium]